MSSTRGSESFKAIVAETIRQIMADEELIIAIVTKVTASFQIKFNEVNAK